MIDVYSVICSCSQSLLLPNNVASLTMTYLHRYKASSCPSIELKELEPTKLIALYTSALLIGCKTSENLRSLRDIFNVVAHVLYPSITMEYMDKSYVKCKESIIEMEHKLLRILCFEVEYDLPYRYLLNMARFHCCVWRYPYYRHLKFRQAHVQIAWTFLNDSFASHRCVSTRPELLAAASLLLALQLHTISTFNSGATTDSSSSNNSNRIDTDGENVIIPKWWCHFHIEETELVNTANWICDIYENIKLS